MKLKAAVFASLLGLAACSQASAPDGLTAALVETPPAAGHQLGGSIDGVVVEPATGVMTIRGWHMLTPQTSRQEIKIYAPGSQSVLSVTSVARPDVAAAVKDTDLENAGFEVRLQLKPGASVDRLCVSFDDKHYGKRVLNPHSPDMVRCNGAK